MRDDRLSLAITHTDGRVTRWGPDEPDPGRVPTDLSFTTSIPGGFKDMQCSLLRDPGVEMPDQGLFDDVRVIGAGNETAWHGRMARFPRGSDDRSVRPSALGWVSHLRDDQTFSRIYIDRDLSGWRGMSEARRGLLHGLFRDVGFQVRSDATAGTPRLTTELVGAWPASPLPLSEALYDAGPGNGIGSIRYAWQRSPAGFDHTLTPWVWAVLTGQDDSFNALIVASTGNLRAAGPGTGTLATAPARFGLVQLYYNGAGGAPDYPYYLQWQLAVIGDHGLTVQGAAPADSAILGHDIVADIVRTGAPRLTYTTGPEGTIQPAGFGVPHLSFREPTRPEDALLAVNRFYQREWGVYGDQGVPEFFWRPVPGDPVAWEARLSTGAKLDLEGDDADEVFTGVLVTYRDVAGTTRTIGPPGSRAEVTDAALAVTDPDNPAVAAGVRRWAQLSVSDITTQAGASAIGAAWLAEKTRPARRGSITLTGTVTHPTRGRRPVWAVRAGDHVRVADHSADVARRIIETRYDHQARTLTATLENTAFGVDALMERMGVALVGVL
jgi:hypothetical protein